MEISRPVEKLAAIQEGLCFMKFLVRLLVCLFVCFPFIFILLKQNMKPADSFDRNCLALNFTKIHPAIFQPSLVEARTQTRRDLTSVFFFLRRTNIKFSNFTARPK